MKKTICFLLLILLTGSYATAQSPIARFKFEDAEAAFATADYRTALLRLEEAEQEFGRINPPILYLRIMARNELLKSEDNLDFDNLEQLRRDSARYLKEYGSLEVMIDQAREVYRVSESLRDYPNTRLAYIDNLIAEHWYQEALDEVARAELPLSPPAQYRKILAMHRVVQMDDYDNTERAGALQVEVQAFLKRVAGKQPSGINAHQWQDVLQIETNLATVEDYRKAKRLHYTEKDYTQALVHYRLAADKGSPMGMAGIGILHRDGLGTAQNHATARQHFERAAALGYPWPMNYLGLMYSRGQGVTQDYARAEEWYSKAASMGHYWAIGGIGDLYYFGWGRPQDYVRAREIYELAGRLGNPGASRTVGLIYANGYGVAQDYVKAREWYLKAAEKGHGNAMNDMGTLYHNARGVERDYAQAKAWYEKGAAVGDQWAMVNLGWLYHKGQGVTQDYKSAVDWYTKAAEKGHANSMKYLAEIYEEGGHGIKRNKKLAREWRGKAEAAGAK